MRQDLEYYILIFWYLVGTLKYFSYLSRRFSTKHRVGTYHPPMMRESALMWCGIIPIPSLLFGVWEQIGPGQPWAMISIVRHFRWDFVLPSIFLRSFEWMQARYGFKVRSLLCYSCSCSSPSSSHTSPCWIHSDKRCWPSSWAYAVDSKSLWSRSTSSAAGGTEDMGVWKIEAAVRVHHPRLMGRPEWSLRNFGVLIHIYLSYILQVPLSRIVTALDLCKGTATAKW